MLSFEPRAILKHCRDTECCRWLDDESCLFVQKPHPLNNAFLTHQHRIIRDFEQIIQDFGDWKPSGNAIGDGIHRFRCNDFFLTPRQRHRRSRFWLDANHFDVWGESLQDITNTRCHGSTTER